MKRFLAVFVLFVFLSGCTHNNNALDRVSFLRKRSIDAQGYSFDAHITADYGDVLHTFTLACKYEHSGNMEFSVKSPESLEGITGTVSGEEGNIAFDDKLLLFDTIAEGQLSPVSAPWIFAHTLQSGFIKGYCTESDGLYLQVNDSYADEALLLEIWTDQNDIPVRAEIVWTGKRILTIEVENFVFL